MTGTPDIGTSLLAAWQTSNRVTLGLVDALPPALWEERIPGARRTVRGVAAHLHNARCTWLKTLGRDHGIVAPARVDHRRATRRQVIVALERSSSGMEALFELGFAAGGVIPPSKGYAWRNLSLDVGHVVTYFIAHEAHHRGQIVLAARQSGHRLPERVTAGLWRWQPLRS